MAIPVFQHTFNPSTGLYITKAFEEASGRRGEALRIVSNIGKWLLSLLAASFIAGFFIAIGFLISALTPEETFILDPISALEFFGFIWAVSIIPIAGFTLIPALILTSINKYRGKSLNKLVYSIVGACVPVISITYGWVWADPAILFRPDQWMWQYFSSGGVFFIISAIAGLIAGYEFAKLRQGALKWE